MRTKAIIDWLGRLLRARCRSSIFFRFPFVDGSDNKWLADISQRILKRSGGVVFSGPFSGMKLLPKSYLTRRPMWAVGCYEQEIEEAILDLIARPPNRIIEIGSAHGYYSVGLATKIANIPIVAFEAEKATWPEAAQLAALNNVSDRIQQRGICTCDELQTVGAHESAVLCDCEGADFELLDPVRVTFLKSSRIICEIHEFYREGLTGELVQRFRNTHDIHLIVEQPRNPTQFRVLDSLSPIEKLLAVRETKHISGKLTAARFLWMRPLNSL